MPSVITASVQIAKDKEWLPDDEPEGPYRSGREYRERYITETMRRALGG